MNVAEILRAERWVQDTSGPHRVRSLYRGDAYDFVAELRLAGS